MTVPDFDDRRLHELLAEQSLFELSAEERDELRRLLASSSIDPESFDYVAAMAALAHLPEDAEPIPADLKSRIAKSAHAIVPAVDRNPLRAGRATPASRGFLREYAPWCVAASAVAALMFVTWQFSGRQPPVAPSASESRALLLKQATDLVQVPWTATKDVTGASGDVIWSAARQQGFLRFKGLAKNDPQKNQYQLWIFDGHQDERYPIDGGVFDVDPESGDVTIPIRAALHVTDPQMFAVTLEKPGGVVVSDRKRIALLAKVPPRKA
jgi:anti-sigma-K factor RskA